MGAVVSFNEIMAWTYSNWPTLSGAAQRTAFNAHLAEVGASIAEDLSAAGRSINYASTVAYRAQLVEHGKLLGLMSLRTTGKATSNQVTFRDPGRSQSGSQAEECR